VGVTGYKVYMGTSSASLIPLASVTTASYSDTGRQPNSTYYYAVSASDAKGNTSALSAVVSTTTLRDTTPPSAPTNVRATPVSSTQVNLSWNASTDNIAMTGYKIYRGKSSSGLILIGSSKTTSYADTQTQPATKYYYQVAASDGSGNLSALSALVSVTTR
jgi:chitinase